jgi:hypothetical protein
MLFFLTKRYFLLSLVLSFALAILSRAAFAQPGNGPGTPPPGRPGGVMPGAAGGPQIAFDRPAIDFLSQGVQQENCINMPLSNKSDHPKLLTILESEDPKHFRINSPVQEMMPMQLEPHSSVYINVCFKADKEKEYHSTLIAVFGDDTLKLDLRGKGVKQKVVGPMPTELALKSKLAKNRINRILNIELPTRSTITLEVDDMLGKPIRKLITNELKSPGEYEIDFNWTDDNQKPMPAGSYLVRLEANSLETHQITHASVPIRLKS